MAVACGAEVPEEIAALYDRGLTLLDLIEGIVRKFPVLRSVTGADVFLEVHCMCDEAFEAVTNWAEQAAILDNLQGSA
jgi:hypothetical protein